MIIQLSSPLPSTIGQACPFLALFSPPSKLDDAKSPFAADLSLLRNFVGTLRRSTGALPRPIFDPAPFLNGDGKRFDRSSTATNHDSPHHLDEPSPRPYFDKRILEVVLSIADMNIFDESYSGEFATDLPDRFLSSFLQLNNLLPTFGQACPFLTHFMPAINVADAPFPLAAEPSLPRNILVAPNQPIFNYAPVVNFASNLFDHLTFDPSPVFNVASKLFDHLNFDPSPVFNVGRKLFDHLTFDLSASHDVASKLFSRYTSLKLPPPSTISLELPSPAVDIPSPSASSCSPPLAAVFHSSLAFVHPPVDPATGEPPSHSSTLTTLDPPISTASITLSPEEAWLEKLWIAFEKDDWSAIPGFAKVLAEEKRREELWKAFETSDYSTIPGFAPDFAEDKREQQLSENGESTGAAVEEHTNGAAFAIVEPVQSPSSSIANTSSLPYPSSDLPSRSSFRHSSPHLHRSDFPESQIARRLSPSSAESSLRELNLASEPALDRFALGSKLPAISAILSSQNSSSERRNDRSSTLERGKLAISDTLNGISKSYSTLLKLARGDLFSSLQWPVSSSSPWGSMRDLGCLVYHNLLWELSRFSFASFKLATFNFVAPFRALETAKAESSSSSSSSTHSTIDSELFESIRTAGAVGDVARAKEGKIDFGGSH